MEYFRLTSNRPVEQLGDILIFANSETVAVLESFLDQNRVLKPRNCSDHKTYFAKGVLGYVYPCEKRKCRKNTILCLLGHYNNKTA